MVKYRIQARNVGNVAASKTALITLPVGPRYHQLILLHGYSGGTNTVAAAAANILDIRVKVNGRIQRQVSGTQLRDMNLLNGAAYDCTGLPNTSPGVSFPIFLAEPWRKDARDQDAMAWPTDGWDTFQVEVDLGAAATPTLEAWAVVDDFVPPKDAERAICKWLRQSWPAAGTQVDISTLDRRDWLTQISLYPAGVAASKVTMRLNGLILHELTKPANDALLLTNGMLPNATGRTANIYDLVADHDDLLGSAVNLNGSRDLTLTVESASAMSGTLTAIIQRIGPPE